ncbi:MAG: YhjD/YihY/BrkB family envelope integrity protein [Kiritimatiellae bacterium]|nr:YhjD/YihY/BrkB family envelope integrity protein [Kiritimatiellia bacterium]
MKNKRFQLLSRLLAGLAHRAAFVWLILRESIKAFVSDINFEFAATLTYYGFLSLMPFLLLVFYLMGLFLRSSDAVLATVTEMVHSFFPAFTYDILNELMALSHRRTWGIVGVVLLLWAVVPFAGTIRFAFGRIFKTARKYNFMVNKLFDMAAVMALLALFMMLVAGKIFYALKAGVVSAKMGAVFPIFNFIVAPALLLAGLAFFYLVFCPVRPRLAEIMTGAILVAALLGIIRPLFGVFLRINPGYGYAFGSLKTIFLILIWIYCTFVVILLGAVVIAVIRRREALLLKGLFHGAHHGKNRLSCLLLNKLIREYDPGDVVFSEDEPGGEMYFVFDGGVDLSKAGRILKRVGPGEYFGEMSMLINTPRTATATVVSEDTQLIGVNAGNFDAIMRENPDIVLALLKEMAERLKAMNFALMAGPAPAGLTKRACQIK